jgi:hypothetical protein
VKKAAALFFIALFLFNLVGYRFVLEYMMHKANTQLEGRLDNNLYDDSQLIELKVPINLPYQTSWAGYQRFNGEIELNGVMYKYVKRKVSNDTLYVMCIPNTKKMNLEIAKNDFLKFSVDLNQNDNSKKSDNGKTISFKNLQGEYDEYSFAVNFNSRFDANQHNWLPVRPHNIFSIPRISPDQPPDLLSA